MQYHDVIAAMFDPAGADFATPGAVSDAAPPRRLRDAFEPLSMHAVWSPLVHQRMSERGLDFFGTYVAGRACVMGQPSGPVVASAFAAFEPNTIAAVWDQACATISCDDVMQITWDSTAESLAGVLADADQAAITEVGSQLTGIVDGLDPTGRPLFAGVQALDWPTDPHGRLWQACLALREHRGDAHTAAYIADGFDPVRMNILTELWLGYPMGEYSGTRAWPEEATAAAIASLRADGLIDEAGELTASGAQVRRGIETRTDAMEDGVVAALGADFDQVCAQLAGWSERCVEAATFPPDPRKRAAG